MKNKVDDKQIMIIRQSSIKAVTEFYNCKKELTINQLIGISELLTEYVIDGVTDEVKDKSKKLDKFFKEQNNKDNNEKK